MPVLKYIVATLNKGSSTPWTRSYAKSASDIYPTFSQADQGAFRAAMDNPRWDYRVVEYTGEDPLPGELPALGAIVWYPSVVCSRGPIDTETRGDNGFNGFTSAQCYDVYCSNMKTEGRSTLTPKQKAEAQRVWTLQLTKLVAEQAAIDKDKALSVYVQGDYNED